MVKCSSCGVREAIYWRKESGEKLCSKCLEKSLIRQVKREISRWSMLEPKDTIGFLFLEKYPLVSISSYNILKKIERDYPSKLYLILPKTLSKVVREENIVYVDNVENKDIVAYYRLLREKALKKAEKAGIEKIVLPTTLEFEITYFTYGFLKYDIEIMGETLPKLHVPQRNIYFVKPFRKVRTKELLIYGYFEGLFRIFEKKFKVKRNSGFSDSFFCEIEKYFWKISCDHFELLDSTLKMSEILVEKILREYGFTSSCRFCGTPIRDNVCSFHAIRFLA